MADPQGRPAPAPLVVLLATALVILLADQLTKALVVATIPVGGRVELVSDLVVLWHVQNTGAAFSLFTGQTWLFYIVTIVALAMIGYFHRAFSERSRWLHVILGVALGGSLGNFVDRIRLGAVTDFVSVGIGDVRFPTFNVADSSIVIGIGLLVAYLLFADSKPEAVRA